VSDLGHSWLSASSQDGNKGKHSRPVRLKIFFQLETWLDEPNLNEPIANFHRSIPNLLESESILPEILG